jgi:hypothetical protein
MNNETKNQIKNNTAINNIKEHPNLLRRKYWNLMWYHPFIHNIISYASIIYWIGLIIYLYTVHTKVMYDIGEPQDFLVFFIVISIYPILYFINEIINTNNEVSSGRIANLDPYYGICVHGPASLTQDERDSGSIAKVNYRCLDSQQTFNEKQSQLIIYRAYSIVYVMFILTLFLMGDSKLNNKNNLLLKDDIFLTTIIQHSLLLAFIIMSSNFFVNYRYKSNILMFLFNNFLQMLGSLLIMAISYLMFKVITQYIYYKKK